MKIIHVQSTIQTIFGVLDDEGNVVSKQPVTLELLKLDAGVAAEIVKQLLSIKEKLARELPKENLTQELPKEI